MQSLTVWSSNFGLRGLPQVEFDLGSFLSSYRRNRGFVVVVVSSSPSGNYLVSRGLRCDSRSKGRDGFFCRYPKVGFGVSVEHKEDFCSPVALACSLEQQEIQNPVHISRQSSLKDDNSDRVSVTNGKCVETQNREVAKEQNAKVDVRALAKSLHSAETADDVEEILKEKGLFPIQVYSTFIRGFAWDKKMKPAFAVVDWLKRKKKETDGAVTLNLLLYNNLLTVVKDCEEYKEADSILNDMAEQSIDPNVVTFNILMAIYLEQDQPSKALDVFEEILQKGLKPTAATYSTALTAYRRTEDGDGLLKLFMEIKEMYLNGELGRDSDDDWQEEFPKLENYALRISYQVMRRWLVRNENMSTRVLKLLKDMDNAELRPSRAKYEKLVWACTREDHYIVAKELYIRIREKFPEISLSVCNHLIWLMGKAKKWWAALEIYENLLDKGPKPDPLSSELIVSHFDVLLTSARKRGIWKWGVRLLNKMQEKGLKPESRQWDAVLVACAKAAETSAAVEIFKRMVEQGEKPTIISYGALLSGLEKAGLYEEAFRVWNHMLKMEVKPNLYAYTIIASVLTAQGKLKMVDAIINEMVSKGIQPTIITYNAIISGFARRGMSDAAYAWFQRMERESISPNEISYQMLIEALVKDGKPRFAYELYLKAQNEKGLSLSSKAYDAVVDASPALTAAFDISLLGPRPPDRAVVGGGRIRKNWTEFTKLADVPRRSKPFEKNEIYYRRAGKRP